MKRSLILAMALAILVVGGWYGFWGRLLNSRISGLRHDIRAEEQKAAAYRRALTELPQLLADYRVMHARLAGSPVSSSGTDEVIALYQTLELRCRKRSLRLNEITPSLEETIRYFRQRAMSDSTIAISISVKTTGPYRQLAGFIEDIERDRFFGRLSRFGIFGSEELYPYCRLDLTFIAELGHRMELAGYD